MYVNLLPNKSVTERVIDIIKYQFDTEGRGDLSADTNLSIFDPDDLDFVEIVMECEDEFDIAIEDGLYDDLKTIADVVAMVEKVLAR